MSIPLITKWIERRRKRKEELEKLFRWRMTTQEYFRWLGEFPDICHVLENLRAVADGGVLVETTLDGFVYRRPVGVNDLREQLRNMRKQTS